MAADRDGGVNFQGGDGDAQTAPMFRAWMHRTLKNVHANWRRADEAQVRKPPAGLVSLDGVGSREASDTSARVPAPFSREKTASSIFWRDESGSLIRQAMNDWKIPRIAHCCTRSSSRAFRSVGSQPGVA